MIDFLGIGAQKAGTTWLMANLKAHPDVWTPIFMKELHYFDVVYLDTDKTARLGSLRQRAELAIEKMRKRGKYPEDRAKFLRRLVDPDYAFTDTWYAEIFSKAPAGKKKGEITPYYCAIGPAGIAHVKRLMPDVKLIYIIRDPFDRALSSLRMLQKMTPNKKQQDIISDPGFQGRGDYANNIPAWDAAFPSAQFLYIPFGAVKADPLRVMRDVEGHLGLSPFDRYPRLWERVNTTAQAVVEIEEESIRKLKELAEPQYIFIRERFGEEFFANI